MRTADWLAISVFLNVILLLLLAVVSACLHKCDRDQQTWKSIANSLSSRHSRLRQAMEKLLREDERDG